jgi:uncharacterized membrane protein (TIGR02234 family)
MSARREYGGAVALCVLGAGLVLFALREQWARVHYVAPAPLPSGSIPVTGQDLQAAASALALAALACLAAIIATRGVARRAAGVVMAALGAWIGWLVSAPVHAAGVLAAAAQQTSSGAFGSGGGSTISGTSPASSGNTVPVIGSATRVVFTGTEWRSAALAGAIAVVAAGLVAAWRGPRWAVMSARFDRQPQQAPAGLRADAAPDEAPGAVEHPGGETDALWEALDRGVDLTGDDAPAGPADHPPAATDEHATR